MDLIPIPPALRQGVFQPGGIPDILADPRLDPFNRQDEGTFKQGT